MAADVVAPRTGARDRAGQEGIAVDELADHLEVERIWSGDTGNGSLPVNLAAEVCARGGRCRLVLTSPGIFEGGWLPSGVEQSDQRELRLDLHGVRGSLVSAAVPRAEVVSGFDLAAWSQGKGGPKPARRVAPAGSVYWLDELEATAEALRKLVERGLWTEAAYATDTRRAEGFNRVAVAGWS